MTTATVHYYSADARTITRTRTYRTAALAWAAIRRAQRRGVIAMYAVAKEAR